jgi:hypothetical protein
MGVTCLFHFRNQLKVYLLTYLLTHLRSWALPEKLLIVQLFRKFPAILRNPKVHHRVHKSINTSDIPRSKSQVHFPSIRSIIQRIHPCPRLLVNVRNKIIFLRWGVVSPTPNLSVEDHLFSAVRDCLFNIFAATLHIWRPFPPSATWGRAMPWWQGTRLI